MTQSSSVPRLALLGRGLFFAGGFLMLTGDWPQTTLLPTRWSVPLDCLAWPWLYLALFYVAFIVLMATGWLRVAQRTTADFLYLPIGVLTATFLLSVIFSLVPSLSAFAFGCLLAVAGFSLAAARIVQDETALVGTSRVIAVAALFLGLRVIAWRAVEGLSIPAYHVGNNAWLGKIQIAWVLNLLAPLMLARSLAERTVRAAVIYGVAWLVSGVAIYVLLSKAGLVTFVVTTLGLCLANPYYWRRWLPPVVGIAILVLGLVTISGGMPKPVVASLMRPDQDAGVVMRYAVWQQTARIIVDHPITGIGLGTYDDVAYSYGRPADPAFFQHGWHAHNLFLHVWAETGTLGFLAWCYFWLTIVRFLLRRWRAGDTLGRLNSTAALCVLLAFFVLSMTEAMIAARVHASLRMNLTLALLVVYGIRLAGPTRSTA